ncbi:MAG: TonB-dependent receptor plug domain-containing protein, partial [Flammeovirgaceae bacterium]
HLFNNRLFVNTTLTYSFYEFAFSNLESFLEVEEEDGALEEELEELYFIDNRSENQDIGLRIDIDYVPAPKHTIRMGLEASVKSFSPVLTFLDSDSEEIIDRLDEDLAIDDLDDYAISTTSEVAELDVYIEDQIDLNANWQLDLGLRASSFLNAGTEKSYFNLEPRILLNHTLSTKLQVHASANRLVQYLHLVSNSALKLPNDLWIPASADMLPQQSWQFELGAAIHISSALHFNVDAYYLNIQNLYRYPDDFSFLDIVNDSRPEDFLLRGDGQNYGIETLLKYDGDNRGFMLSYTLSKAERQYDSLNLGMPFPYDLDHRHRLKLFFFQKLGEHFQIGLNWIYSSATPRLNLVDTQLGQGFIRTDLNPSGRKNELRASPYYRFDLNVSYHRIGKKLEHRLVLGTYNTFDRRNIAYYQVNANSTTHPVGFMPIVPSISYTLNY